jgi:hypothetical protein
MNKEKELRAQINCLVGQLQNCVNYLEYAKRHTVMINRVYDAAIDSANKAIYSVTKGKIPPSDPK